MRFAIALYGLNSPNNLCHFLAIICSHFFRPQRNRSYGCWMGQVSQKDDEEKRREEARHFGLLRFPGARTRLMSLKSYGADRERRKAQQIGEPSEARVNALKEWAERQEGKQTAWRIGASPPRLEFKCEWVLHLATGSRIARRRP